MIFTLFIITTYLVSTQDSFDLFMFIDHLVCVILYRDELIHLGILKLSVMVDIVDYCLPNFKSHTSNPKKMPSILLL